jgi:hypothetical protein
MEGSDRTCEDTEDTTTLVQIEKLKCAVRKLFVCDEIVTRTCSEWYGSRVTGFADYIMYSTFLTASPGSVLFSRSNLLKRKDLCFSCLRLVLIRHRRSLRSSHLSSQVLHDSHRVTLEKLIF